MSIVLFEQHTSSNDYIPNKNKNNNNNYNNLTDVLNGERTIFNFVATDRASRNIVSMTGSSNVLKGLVKKSSPFSNSPSRGGLE